MKISLVIPAYNEEKLIGECLRCVFTKFGDQHSFEEIIVVDNGSSDATALIAGGFPNVKVVSEQQKGIMFARQKGFEVSTGDVIAYIDADTQMPAGWCQLVLNTFATDPNIACVSGPYKYYDIKPWEQALIKTFFFISRFFYHLFGQVVIGGNFAIRREILEKMNGMDTKISFYGDDANIGRRAALFGKVVYDPRLIMKTSGRRLISQGLFKTFFMYAIGYFSEAICKKNIFHSYKDFR